MQWKFTVTLFAAALAPLAASCTTELSVDEEAAADTGTGEQPLFGGQNDDGSPCWNLPTCWWPHRELAESFDVYRGSPAWADDGSDVAVIESHYQRRLSFPPLQGWWDRRDFSFRVAVTEPNARSRAYLTDELPGQAIELFHQRGAGYVLVKRFVADTGTLDWLRVDLVDGEAAVVSTQPLGPSVERDVVPAPDGETIAEVSCERFREVPQPDGSISIEPVSPVPCTARFLDAWTLAEVGQAVVSLPEEPPFVPSGADGATRQLPRATWTPAGTLVLTDWAATAFEVAPGSTPAPAAVPTCRGPVTVSGKVSAAGQRIAVKDGRVKVVATNPAAADTFGCQ
jgi:hypothetical protein